MSHSGWTHSAAALQGETAAGPPTKPVPNTLLKSAAGLLADPSCGFQLPVPGSSAAEQHPAPSASFQAEVSASWQGAQGAAQRGGRQQHTLADRLLSQPLYHVTPRQQQQQRQQLQQCREQRQQHGVQRGLLGLLMPPLADQFAELMPVRVEGVVGPSILLVLPSDGPSSRQEAEAASSALHALLSDPATAAQRGAAWRQQLLMNSSSAALLGLTADYTPVEHVQQLRHGPSQHGGGGGVLAGPSWLAASSGSGSASQGSGSSSGGASHGAAGPSGADLGTQHTFEAAAIQGVRSSSSFLRSDGKTSLSRLDSPLPPLVTTRSTSRLGAALPPPPSVCVSAAAGSSGWQEAPLLLPLGPSASQHLSLGSAGAEAAPADAAGRVALQGSWAQQALAADGPAWDAYCCASLAAGLAVCMAEAVRQVEVGCAERGRLLAQLWNSYTGVLAVTIQQQHEQLGTMAASNANLMAEASQLRWENSTMSFLRTEISRLRKDKDTVALQLADCQQEMAAYQESAEVAGEDQRHLEIHLQRRLAVLRWRHAAAAVLAPGWRGTAQARPGSGGTGGGSESSTMMHQIAALERTAVAVVEAKQRQQAYKQSRQAEAALASMLSTPASSAGDSGSRLRPRLQSRLQHGSNAVGGSEAMQPQRRAAPGGATPSSSPAAAGPAVVSSITLIRCLRPEARVVMLLSMPAQQRQQLLAAMSDAERASLVVLVDESSRLQLYDEMGGSAVATDAYIGRKPILLARQLATLTAEQAAAHFSAKLMPQQQQLVLQAAPPQQAAGLLGPLTEGQQRQLLQTLLPHAAAGLLEWLVPASAMQLLLLPAASSPPSRSAAADGTSGSEAGCVWLEEVLARLPDRQLSAMLATAQPGELAVLLERLPEGLQQRALHLLPAGGRAAALAAAHQRQATIARQGEATPGAPLAALARAAAASQLAARSGSSALQLDPASALLAHFQQLTAAEKPSMLLMGSAAVASLLLPLLGDSEVGDVLLLLPQQRQREVLQALHPQEEGRILGVAREADRRRSSLLPAQQLAALAAAAESEVGTQEAVGNGNGPSRRGSAFLPHQLDAAAVAAEEGGQASRRRSSLRPQQLAAAAAEAGVGPRGGEMRRSSLLGLQQLEAAASADKPAGAARRGSLQRPQQLAAAALEGARRKSTLFAVQQQQPAG